MFDTSVDVRPPQVAPFAIPPPKKPSPFAPRNQARVPCNRLALSSAKHAAAACQRSIRRRGLDLNLSTRENPRHVISPRQRHGRWCHGNDSRGCRSSRTGAKRGIIVYSPGNGQLRAEAAEARCAREPTSTLKPGAPHETPAKPFFQFQDICRKRAPAILQSVNYPTFARHDGC
jgi:hypothetical protein